MPCLSAIAPQAQYVVMPLVGVHNPGLVVIFLLRILIVLLVIAAMAYLVVF